MSRGWMLRVLAGFAAFLGAGSAWADIHVTPIPEYNMPQGVTPISHQVYDLHMMMFWVCVAIGIIVFSIMGYSMVMHRKSRGHEPSQVHENTKLEITWTIIPFLILVAVTVPTAATVVNMYDDTGSAMSVKVTGYQWLWHYKYMKKDVGFYSKLSSSSNKARQIDPSVSPWKVKHYLQSVDHPLVLPTHTKVRLLITSADVIHSWWVPQLGFKMDAIPGYINKMWVNIQKPGTYRGQCAELCGRGHGYMPIVVKAVPQKQFKKWLSDHQDKNKKAGSGEKESGQSADSGNAQTARKAAATGA